MPRLRAAICPSYWVLPGCRSVVVAWGPLVSVRFQFYPIVYSNTSVLRNRGLFSIWFKKGFIPSDMQPTVLWSQRKYVRFARTSNYSMQQTDDNLARCSKMVSLTLSKTSNRLMGCNWRWISHSLFMLLEQIRKMLESLSSIRFQVYAPSLLDVRTYSASLEQWSISPCLAQGRPANPSGRPDPVRQQV